MQTLVHECLYTFHGMTSIQTAKKMFVTHSCVIIYKNSPTSTNRDDNAAKWMQQPLIMILFFKQATLVLHDKFLVKASVAVRCDNQSMT